MAAVLLTLLAIALCVGLPAVQARWLHMWSWLVHWIGWLVLTASLSLAAQAYGKPLALIIPPLAILFLVSLIVHSSTLYSRSWLFAWPAWLLVALQAFRILVELGLWLMYRAGQAPVQVTLEGYNFDYLAAVTAPVIAWAIYRRWLGRRAIVVWNLCGLAVLATAIWSIATSTPGPLRLAWPGEPFAAIGQWPAIWIPTFFAPIAIWLHLLSIWQVLRVEPGKGISARPD